MRVRVVVGLIFVGLVLGIHPAAPAHPITWSDGSDSRDPSREMEIRRVAQDHEVYGGRRQVVFRIRTHGDMTEQRLGYNEGDGWPIFIRFNTDSDDVIEKLLHVDGEPDPDGGYTLGVEVWGRPVQGAGSPAYRRFLGYGTLARPAADRVVIRFPARLIGARRDEKFRWSVATSWDDEDESATCGCDVVSYDYAPGNGYRRGHV